MQKLPPLDKNAGTSTDKARKPGRRWPWGQALLLIVAGALLFPEGDCQIKEPEKADFVVNYSPGRWRLAQFQELNETVLWVSHIVVLHNRSVRQGALRGLVWEPEVLPLDRSDAEALVRARAALHLLSRDPGAFESVAIQYSDDVVTRSRGGSLGGIRAAQLPPEYLDALATLKPGDVSRIFRTPFGYHILKRRSAPPAANVSGKRIVVRYKTTVVGSSDAGSDRSREAALRIAERLAALARSEPSEFDTLVRTYSEGSDSAQFGDIGLRSTVDPGALPREIERLSEMQIGEISEPMDSRFGFEILMRTEARSRLSYAMTAIVINVDLIGKADPSASKDKARLLAQALAKDLRDDPLRFESLQEQYCCKSIESWSQAQGPAGLDAVLDGLSFGEIAPEPVQSGLSFYIPKRLHPLVNGAPASIRYELPSPDAPDFIAIVEHSEGVALARHARRLAEDAAVNLHLADPQAKDLAEQFARLSASFERSADGIGRVATFKATLENVRMSLGPTAYKSFEVFMNGWAEKIILGESGSLSSKRK